jgi:hypothetical protein
MPHMTNDIEMPEADFNRLCDEFLPLLEQYAKDPGLCEGMEGALCSIVWREVKKGHACPKLDIDEQVSKALEWADKKIGCDMCRDGRGELTKDPNPPTQHTPVCLLMHHITTSRGAHGRVVMIDPHHSAL